MSRNILENGDLDLPDSTLGKADWVLAAFHYSQNQSQRKITERLINAIKNRNVNAIAHASGRLIGKRPGYDADFKEVFKAAADYEVNGQPNRLDINDSLLELANKYSVSFVLNSDAHSTSELDYMEYAVDQARRGSIFLCEYRTCLRSIIK